MAESINVTGKVDLMVAFDSYDELDKLGEAMDMHDIEERAFFHNVPGDRHGGPQGPPIEIQYLGSIVVVRVELSRWDPDVFDELRKRKVQATTGKVLLSEVGTPLLAANYFRLLLLSTTRPISFPCVVCRDAMAYGMGSKFSSVGLQFECHRMPATVVGWAAEGVLWNSDVPAEE